MRKHNAENERIKRAYFLYLKEARRLGAHSIDAAAAALSRFEEYNKYRDFKRFHTQQAVGFKRRLAEQLSQQTGELLSKPTLFTTLNALRAFFHWLAGQPGYRLSVTATVTISTCPKRKPGSPKHHLKKGRHPSSRFCTSFTPCRRPLQSTSATVP